MKKKIRITTIIVSILTLIMVGVYLQRSSSMVNINNQKLQDKVKSVETESVKLNDVIPFEWDVVYTFPPYSVNKEDIEKIIGFKSRHIRVNNINEGIVHLLFVKNKEVVASVLGYSSNLGYSIQFPSEITFKQDAIFDVTNTNGIISLSYNK